MKFIKKFEDISLTDLLLVGGKNASLGEMIQQLTPKGIKIPRGFAITVDGYWHYINSNNFLEPMKTIMASLKDPNDLKTLNAVGSEIRQLLANGKLPDDVLQEVDQAYQELSKFYNQNNVDVAVRSSATAEDLPTASFAGQQETFLNVKGAQELHQAIKKSIASLFTDRAIFYRIEHKFDHFHVGLSIGIQKMIRSDLASSGVIFTLDTESGFKNVVMINSSFGLGEAIVKGEVNPDEFCVFKPTLQTSFSPIIKKYCGNKTTKIVYKKQGNETETVSVPVDQQHQFSLADQEILELARQAVLIEDHYSALKKQWCPMDIEWAKDGNDQQLYIVQARPETVHASDKNERAVLTVFSLDLSAQEQEKKVLLSGQSIGQKIVAGPAKIIKNIQEALDFKQGDILVTSMTDPDWVPIMKKAGAIITDKGGRTCHAAIVSRELGIPALVGTETATHILKSEQNITVDCSTGLQGFVYDGVLSFKKQNVVLKDLSKPPVPVWVNIANPEQAFSASFLPTSGVGLARIEFIIANDIQIHPMATLHPEKIQDKKILETITQRTAAYPSLPDYFVSKLAQGIGTIAAAWYPRPVIVRLSDFKSNEYRSLLGGQYFEPEEENPMLGLRGASRYYNPLYKDTFALECKALLKVREAMGLDNVKIMIPFVRTPAEGKTVLDLMTQHNLVRGKNNLEIIMMVEIPSNVLLIDQFCKLFDGFSIGSNDLTQTTLAVDRDSALLAPLFDERDEAVKMMMSLAIKGTHKQQKPIGICGQAPSDYPDVAQFLINEKIDYLSLNVDAVLPFLMRK